PLVDTALQEVSGNERQDEDRHRDASAARPTEGRLVSLAGEVADEGKGDAPRHAAQNVPKQEFPGGHAGRAGGGRNHRPQEGRGPSEEDRRCSTFVDPRPNPRPSFREAPLQKYRAIAAADRESEEVSQNGSPDRGRDHSTERHRAARREDASQHHRDLAGYDEAEEERGLRARDRKDAPKPQGGGDGAEQIDKA